MQIDAVPLSLINRYKDIYPLIFHRSVERARSVGDLFDILDTIPNKFPIIWDDDQRRWVFTEDVLQVKTFSASCG